MAWSCTDAAASSCRPTAGSSRSSGTWGLYVNPPAHAIVFSIDEESQIQALDRTQPGLPMKKGRAGTMIHDYKRHGTTTRFAARKHPKVRAWLDRHPRITFHFTPISCSWLNAVEGFFARFARPRLQRGSFHSLVDLQAAINRFVAEHSQTNPTPFRWTADPDKFIAAAWRGHQTLESIH